MASLSSEMPLLAHDGLPFLTYPYEPKPGDSVVVSSSPDDWARRTSWDIRENDKGRWLDATYRNVPEDFWSSAWIQHRGRRYCDLVLKYIILNNHEEIGSIATKYMHDATVYQIDSLSFMMEHNNLDQVETIYEQDQIDKYGYKVLVKSLEWIRLIYKQNEHRLPEFQMECLLPVTLQSLKARQIVPPERPDDLLLPTDYFAEYRRQFKELKATKEAAAALRKEMDGKITRQRATKRDDSPVDADSHRSDLQDVESSQQTSQTNETVQQNDQKPPSSPHSMVIRETASDNGRGMRGGGDGERGSDDDDSDGDDKKRGRRAARVPSSPKGKKRVEGDESEGSKFPLSFLHRRVKSTSDSPEKKSAPTQMSRADWLTAPGVERRAVSTESQSQLLTSATTVSGPGAVPIHARGGAQLHTGQYGYHSGNAPPVFTHPYPPNQLLLNEAVHHQQYRNNLGYLNAGVRPPPDHSTTYSPGPSVYRTDPNTRQMWLPNPNPHQSGMYTGLSPRIQAQQPAPTGISRGVPRQQRDNRPRNHGHSQTNSPHVAHNPQPVFNPQSRQPSTVMANTGPVNTGIEYVHQYIQSPQGSIMSVYYDARTGQILPPPPAPASHGQHGQPYGTPYVPQAQMMGQHGHIMNPTGMESHGQRNVGVINNRPGMERQLSAIRQQVIGPIRVVQTDRRESMQTDPTDYGNRAGPRGLSYGVAPPMQPTSFNRAASSNYGQGPSQGAPKLARRVALVGAGLRPGLSNENERFPEYRDELVDVANLPESQKCTAHTIGPDAEDVVTLWFADIPEGTTPGELKAFIEHSIPVADVKDPISYDGNSEISGRGWTFVKFFSNAATREALVLFPTIAFKGYGPLKVQVPERRCSDARTRLGSRGAHASRHRSSFGENKPPIHRGSFGENKSTVFRRDSFSDNTGSAQIRGPSSARNSRAGSVSQGGAPGRRNSVYTLQDARSDLPLPGLPEVAEAPKVPSVVEKAEDVESSVAESMQPPPKRTKKKGGKGTRGSNKNRESSVAPSESNVSSIADVPSRSTHGAETESNASTWADKVSKAVGPSNASNKNKISERIQKSSSKDQVSPIESISSTTEGKPKVPIIPAPDDKHAETREGPDFEAGQVEELPVPIEEQTTAGAEAPDTASEVGSLYAPCSEQGDDTIEESTQPPNVVQDVKDEPSVKEELKDETIVGDAQHTSNSAASEAGVSEAPSTSQESAAANLLLRKGAAVTESLSVFGKKKQSAKPTDRKKAKKEKQAAKKGSKSVSAKFTEPSIEDEPEVFSLEEIKAREKAGNFIEHTELESKVVDAPRTSEDHASQAGVTKPLENLRIQASAKGKERVVSYSNVNESSSSVGTHHTAPEYPDPASLSPTPETSTVEVSHEAIPAGADSGEEVGNTTMSPIISHKKPKKKNRKKSRPSVGGTEDATAASGKSSKADADATDSKGPTRPHSNSATQRVLEGMSTNTLGSNDLTSDLEPLAKKHIDVKVEQLYKDGYPPTSAKSLQPLKENVKSSMTYAQAAHPKAMSAANTKNATAVGGLVERDVNVASYTW